MPKLRPGPIYVPGYRYLELSSIAARDFLLSETLTPRLNVFPFPWLVSKQHSWHIASLTEQIVRGRRIIITENPELHLVWYHDRVHIKPLPRYLISYDWWHYTFSSNSTPFVDPTERLVALQAAKGLLRSYTYLIQRRSDFELAQNAPHRILPKKLRFSASLAFFSSVQRSIADKDVSRRWHSGDVRLTRLNFWSKVFLRELNYHKIHGQYSDRMARFYAPLLFVFAVFSVVLNAMQVGLTADPIVGQDAFGSSFGAASQAFSLLSLSAVALTILLLLLALLVPLLLELIGACAHLREKRNPTEVADDWVH